MELTLNLAWLALSAVLLLAGGWYGGLESDRNRGLIVLTLVCVVCLLFPVISLTDDLNSSPAISEGSKLKKAVLSVQVVVALLSRIVLQAGQDKSWSAQALQYDSGPPPEELLTFQLNRRPPPSFDLLS
ncbi:MAG TPA: hypothetical protein VJA94_20990 [Candidatus Angelobacter sp.]